MFTRSCLIGTILVLLAFLAALSPGAGIKAWDGPTTIPPLPSGRVADAAGSPSLESRASLQKRKQIVFTANQGFLSRVYVLRMDGSVVRFFEYVNYRFVDLEVVDNKVYASEAFAPRVYRIDIRTGDLDVIIDDWTLYYFYGLAFDGTYFYLDEWDFRRYTKNGDFVSSTSFDDDVFGSAWDGAYLWILGEDNLVRCWNLNLWPNMTEKPSNHFIPPSPYCRGLWYDGEYFWSAESIPDTLGMIYKFDHQGQVAGQWLAPAWQGWGACTVEVDP